MYRPLDDRDEHSVDSAVGHDGPGQLPPHLADPNSNAICLSFGLTGEPPMKSTTACRPIGRVVDSSPPGKFARHVPETGRKALTGPSFFVSARSTNTRSSKENCRATSGECVLSTTCRRGLSGPTSSSGSTA